MERQGGHVLFSHVLFFVWGGEVPVVWMIYVCACKRNHALEGSVRNRQTQVALAEGGNLNFEGCAFISVSATNQWPTWATHNSHFPPL